MIKAIILDIGGVYLSGDGKDVLSFLSKKFKLDAKQKREISSLYYYDLTFGGMKRSKFFRNAADILGTDSNHMKASWLAAVKLKRRVYKPLERFVRCARRSGYKTAALTNVNEVNFKFFNDLGYYGAFDAVVASCEVGVMKPESKIYHVLFDRLKLIPCEMLFIDNNRKNLAKGKKLGMKTILYTNFSKLMRDVAKLGIKVNY
jgi:epoxide hydrolase-like predicted phosphatase